MLKLASLAKDTPEKTLLMRGVNPESLESIVSAVAGVGTPLTVKEIVDDAFLPKQGYRTSFPIGRFGDGTKGVYYAALEEVTCERELGFRLSAEFADMALGAFDYPRFFTLINCGYAGTTAELRGKEVAYPDLMSATVAGYPFCQSLGSQAGALGIDGFYTASARHAGGTCVPVFARPALSDPKIEYQVKAVAEHGEVQFQRVP